MAANGRKVNKTPQEPAAKKKMQKGNIQGRNEKNYNPLKYTIFDFQRYPAEAKKSVTVKYQPIPKKRSKVKVTDSDSYYC
jgi:hypothetical protein